MEDITREFVVIIQFKDEDKHILKCPIEQYESLVIATVTNSEFEATKILQINKIGELEVECRWAKQASYNCGVIGQIPCPNEKETMDHKIGVYKAALRNSGNPVRSIEWIKKKVWRRGTRGHTTQTSEFLKLEFINEVPNEVFLGRVKYDVKEYVAETTQCWNCQKLGHISTHCKSQPACVFCGTKGHRKGDNQCGNRRVCCANCRGSHPSSYRGCIAFLREKEAQRIRAKDKTPLYNARKLASKKEFPHLRREEEQEEAPSIHPDEEPTREYAEALSLRNPPRRPTNPPQRPELPAPRRTQEETGARPRDRETLDNNQDGHSCSCTTNVQNLEKKMKIMLKQAVTKILTGLTQVLLEITNAEKSSTSTTEKGRLETAINQIFSTLDSAPDSDKESSDSHSESEETSEEEPTDQPKQQRKRATSKYRSAKERRKRKRKKKGKWE